MAVLALGLGIAYQGDRSIPDEGISAPAVTVAGSPGGPAASPPQIDGGDDDVDDGAAADSVSPIERFLPSSGQASACREPVGVDLVPGYAATLSINGIAIAPDEMNVILDGDGSISDEVTASRSIGQYTFGPEEDCPNGRVLRPTDNVLRACVYRLEEGPSSCVVSESVFDVL